MPEITIEKLDKKTQKVEVRVAGYDLKGKLFLVVKTTALGIPLKVEGNVAPEELKAFCKTLLQDAEKTEGML